MTVRERILKAIELVEVGMSGPALVHLDAVLRELDESETAWRSSGGTYRLVPDEIEVKS